MIISSQLNAQDSLSINQKVTKINTDRTIYVDTSKLQILKFAPKFKEKYKSNDFNYEVKTQQKNAWDRFKDWLSYLVSKIFGFSNKQASMSFVEILLKTLATAIIIAVIYLIVKIILNKEGQWIFGKNSDKKIIRYDDIEKNLRLVDFESLIKNALKSGEKRLTIRYYYLWLLKIMSEKEIILWDIEKTNSDYLHEIKNQNQKDNFAYLSYLYNYVWYGEFEIDQSTFEKAKLAFEKTIQSL